ncbi:hypothetical protein JD844_016673 [Phrynosoma platyrhinos]|uniref:Uncharacterized protein n=1 Tax=Phrynosoma platyrhinos TaxID=52577 RepID=A0ABQ7SKP4_PHRPL|nr:hypothetical protein JD844_016673 [Phrynosoma platyrhinos]
MGDLSVSEIWHHLNAVPFETGGLSSMHLEKEIKPQQPCDGAIKVDIKAVLIQSTIEKGWRHLPKDRDCKGFGCAFRQLTNSKKMRRLDTISNSIKASFSIAKLKSRLHKPKQLKHNRTYKKQNVWESLKTTS